ncbi:MAG: CapA family protein [Dehalococcoidia bacterium]
MASVQFFVAACNRSPAEQSAAPTTTTALSATQPAAGSPSGTSSPTITLVAVGDIMLGRSVVSLMDRYGPMYPFENVASDLGSADIAIGNLEGTFTECGTSANKEYVFRTPPRYATGLAQSGIDVVSLANNHTLDYGPEGLHDTLAALTASGVAYSGAGDDEASARRPAILEAQGLRVAFLSYAATADATFATASTAGAAAAAVDAITEDVRQAKDQADIVVVSLHAGSEYETEPSPTQRALAEAAVAAGATIVLGHHPHVLQPYELRDGSLIAYSLGNFVFDTSEGDVAELGDAPLETVMLKIRVSAGGVESVEPVPLYIDPYDHRPGPASPAQAEEILRRIGAVATP